MLIELRMRDVDLAAGADGGRFLVKCYPKDGEYRRLKADEPDRWPQMGGSHAVMSDSACGRSSRSGSAD